MPAADLVLAADPMTGIIAVELGAALGKVDAAAVSCEEQAGRRFSVVRGAGGRRESPVFQAWPGIAGTPLCQVLSQLGETTRADTHGFFAGMADLLAGPTPIEVRTGKVIVARHLDEAPMSCLDFLGNAGSLRSWPALRRLSRCGQRELLPHPPVYRPTANGASTRRIGILMVRVAQSIRPPAR